MSVPKPVRANLVRPVMPELDVLRGVAILGVVFLHGFYWPYGSLHFSRPAHIFVQLTQPGWMGVNLFFVLSGFLITGILVDSKGNADYYKRFYIRRALRILPVYYALLILLLVVGKINRAYFMLSFLYLSNVTNLFGVPQFYGVLWSLSVEEHYYLLWPAIVRKLTRPRLAVSALLISGLVPLVRATSFSLGITENLGSYTWCVADGLASGGLIAVLLRTSITRKKVWQASVALLGGSIIFAAIGTPFGILTRNRVLGAAFQYSVINFGCCGVLMAVLLIGTSSFQGFLHHGWLRFLGYISYGLYLIHLLIFTTYDSICAKLWPRLIPTNDKFVIVILRFVLSAGSAVGIAYLSRRYFEEMFLRLKHRFASDPSGASARGAGTIHFGV